MVEFNYQLSLLKIPVADLKRCADFYEHALKFKPVFISREYGWAQFEAGDLSIALYVPGQGGGDGRVGGSGGFHLQLPGEAFDVLAADLLDMGVLVEGRVHHGDDGSTFIQVLDPDRNIVHVSKLG